MSGSHNLRADCTPVEWERIQLKSLQGGLTALNPGNPKACIYVGEAWREINYVGTFTLWINKIEENVFFNQSGSTGSELGFWKRSTQISRMWLVEITWAPNPRRDMTTIKMLFNLHEKIILYLQCWWLKQFLNLHQAQNQEVVFQKKNCRKPSLKLWGFPLLTKHNMWYGSRAHLYILLAACSRIVHACYYYPPTNLNVLHVKKWKSKRP